MRTRFCTARRPWALVEAFHEAARLRGFEQPVRWGSVHALGRISLGWKAPGRARSGLEISQALAAKRREFAPGRQ